MTDRKRTRLTDAGIARLRPREREYAVWDTAVPGLGVRVRPTGGKTYVLLRREGDRTRRTSLSPVSARTIDEVRRECHARRSAGEPDRPREPKQPVPLFRDFVENAWKEAHFDRCKPSTRRAVRSALSAWVLPAFGSKPLDRIAPAQVGRWFDEHSRTSPGGANRTLDVVRQIMNFAIACGHVETNPTQGVRKNRRPPLNRFLSRAEIDRLYSVLDTHADRGGESRKQVDIIRLLLLTGCRKGEIVRLRWSEVHESALMLADSKTGPRKVPLNSQARQVLERQPQGQSPFVFPSPLDASRPRGDHLRLWRLIRREADIEDVRLHDLRHSFASHAVMNGVPVPVVSRLLGHSNVRMTLRYAHLGDRDIEAAAERVGQAIGDILGLHG